MLSRLGLVLPRRLVLRPALAHPAISAFHTSAAMATSKNAVIPQADRMFAGNTHKLDVWSIFTCV
jgi:hypothetical protein